MGGVGVGVGSEILIRPLLSDRGIGVIGGTDCVGAGADGGPDSGCGTKMYGVGVGDGDSLDRSHGSS